LGAYVRKTKKVKRATNIAHLKKMGPRGFSNKYLEKQLEGVEKIAEKDAYWDEFFSYNRPWPIGGQYVMPEIEAKRILQDIYGTGPTLEKLKAGNPEEFDELEAKRRRANPVPEETDRNVKVRVPSNIPGVSKFIGNMPKTVPRSGRNEMVIQGGSQDSKLTEVWLSGGSQAFSFGDR